MPPSPSNGKPGKSPNLNQPKDDSLERQHHSCPAASVLYLPPRAFALMPLGNACWGDLPWIPTEPMSPPSTAPRTLGRAVPLAVFVLGD